MSKATLKDVAERAGVSTATVSYVLNGKKESISKDTKAKVLQAVKELKYVTNMSAKSLVVKDSKLIGVVIPQTEGNSSQLFVSNFYGEILSSIEFKAREYGYQIIISGVDVDENFLRIALERSLDGIIVIGAYKNDFFDSFSQLDIPVVLVDSYCKNGDFCNVRIDDEAGSYLATKYLIDFGHKSIGFLCGALKENGVMQKRYLGYCRALSEANLNIVSDYIYEDKVSFESGTAFAKKIAKNHMDITGVVTTADILAIGMMKGFSVYQVNIPEDISIIGFDDLEISRYLSPGLTTVKQQISEKGECAMKLLMKQINGAFQDTDIKDLVLPIKIIERYSVKRLNET